MKTFKIYIGMVLLNTIKAMNAEEALMIYTPYVKKKYGQEAVDTLRIKEVI